MSPRILLSCSLALFLAAALPGQGVDLPGRQGPPRDRGRLDLPEPPPAPAPAQEEPAAKAPDRPVFFPEPANRYEEVFARFEAEPRVDAGVLRRYLDELRGLGLESRKTALQALDAPRPETVILAARLLESVGLPEDAEVLVAKASKASEVSATVACLETALRLGGGRLPAGAVRLLDHPRRNVRAAVEARLAAGPNPDHRLPLIQRLRFGRDVDVRIRAARVLRHYVADPEVRRALLETLDSGQVSLAFTAADSLLGGGSDEDVAWLREQVAAGPPGEANAYLMHVLLQIQEEQHRLLAGDEVLAVARQALPAADPFVAGTAAVALAEALFRTPGDTPLEALEVDILEALVRAVAGVPFYPQYSRLAPLAEGSLERITGEDLAGQEPAVWLQWLAAHRAGFRAARAALPVGDEELSRLAVRWRRGTGPERLLAGPDAGLAPGAGVRLLGPRDQEALLHALEAAGILEATVLPGAYGPEDGAPAAVVEVDLGDRSKRLLFREPAGLGWLPGLLDALDGLWNRHEWQLLAPPGRERDFVLTNLAVWDGLADSDRPARMVSFSVGRLAGASDAALAAWAGLLAAAPGLDAAWDPAVSRELLEELGRRRPGAELGGVLVRAALRRPDPSLTRPLVEALAEREEPLRSDLLLEGLGRLGPEACSTCLGDPRLPVRVAAARALGRVGAGARPYLLQALEDPNPLVVRMALRSLGEIRDPEDLARVLEYARPGNSREVRKEALWGLGRYEDPSVLPILRSAAQDEDAGIRLAAVQALGRIPGREAEDVLSGLVPDFLGTFLEAPFVRALEERGAAAARRVLEPHLEAPDPAVARRAAVLAGRLGDPAAAPYLMGILPQAPRDGELLDALAAATGADYRNMPDPAGVYAFWWRDHGGEDPARWLAQAARQVGIALPEDFPDASRVPRAEAIRALLALLENGPAHLRPLAAFHLHALTGVDTPAIRDSTPPAVVQERARFWEQWLEQRAAGG